MRIEISKFLKTKMLENDLFFIDQLAIAYNKGNFLTSVEDNGHLVVLECIDKKYTNTIRKGLVSKYDVKLLEDRFMAEIDLMDMLG